MAQAFTVLIVDDDPLVRGSVVGIIEAKGFRLLAAESAIEATRILAQKHVDVLFTDIVMPGSDGIELAKQAKRLQPGIQLMFSTARRMTGGRCAHIHITRNMVVLWLHVVYLIQNEA